MKKLLFILACSILLLSFVSADLTAPTDYWKFNQYNYQNATDSAGGLTLNNTGTASYVAGKLGNATYINNTSPDLKFSRQGNSNFAFSTGTFSILFWINASSFGGNGILMQTDETSTAGWGVNANDAGDTLTFLNNNGVVLTTGDIADGLWHRIAYVREGTGASQFKLYVDNVNTQNATLASDITDATSALAIYYPNSNLYLDDLRIYKGDALTVTEIGVDYASGFGQELGTLYTTNNLLFPYTSLQTLNATLNFSSYSFVQGNQSNLANISLYIWYSNGTNFNYSTKTITNSQNYSNFTVSGFGVNNYIWNTYACGTNTTGTICNFGSNRTFGWGVEPLVINYSINAYETDNDILNLTFNLSSGTPTGNLWWNGTSYSATATSLGSGIWKLERNLTIPSGTGVKNLFWEIVTGGNSFNTQVYNQAVNLTNWSLCGSAPQNVPFLNFTFKNETTLQESVTATFTSTWYYWIGGDQTVNKSLSYTSAVELGSYSFCLSPSSRTAKTDLSATYDNSESQARSYNPGTALYTSSVNNTVLYLLPTSAGIYVTFQVINQAEQTISGASIIITRPGVGVVGSASTDDAGTAAFFLDPLASYSISVSASGYTPVSTTIIPSQSSYTIQMSATSVSTVNDTNRGISYSITPTALVLNNNTQYAFNFTINSTYWNLQEFGFNLGNGTAIFVTNSTTGVNFGTLSSIMDTGNNRTVVMNAYWIVNGTYGNATQIWSVLNLDDNAWSLFRFFQDFKTYIGGNGIFGLKTFGVTIFVFLLIFVFTGVMSYKFGLTSPATIMGVMFALVLFFDVGVDLIPSPIGGAPNFPFATVIIGIIFIGALIREVSR